MALLVRRPSDWSVVLRTENGSQISFDRENRRISAKRESRTSPAQHQNLSCPLCHRPVPDLYRREQNVHAHESFVHPEYFGFLAASLDGEEAVEPDYAGDHLSQQSFNQGYFERFFIPEGLLGRGGRGEVIRVRHVLEGVSLGTFALKRITVGDSQTWLIRMLREVQSLRFKHENLVSYNHVWLEHSQINSFGPRVPVLHILQQYCNGGDLETFVLKKCGKTPVTVDELKDRARRASRGRASGPEMEIRGLHADMIFSFFRDILSGLAFLHESGMIHRDIKPSNCLLDVDPSSTSIHPRVLVSDFGEAQLGTEINVRTGGTGTLSYTAPEIIRGEAWTQSADMFSLGLILYFLTHEGKLPYHKSDADFDGLKAEILAFQGYQSQRTNLSSELGHVLAQLLSPHPASRPSCVDLIAMMQLHDPTMQPDMHSKVNPTPLPSQLSENHSEIWKQPDLQVIAFPKLEASVRKPEQSGLGRFRHFPYFAIPRLQAMIWAVLTIRVTGLARSCKSYGGAGVNTMISTLMMTFLEDLLRVPFVYRFFLSCIFCVSVYAFHPLQCAGTSAVV